MDLSALVTKTSAYKIFCEDVKNGQLSHAYALFCADKVYLRSYLKKFAQRLVRKGKEVCGVCRECKLIESENFADLKIYPQSVGGKPKTEDIENLIEESYLKPIEGRYKIFIIDATLDFSVICQNKLLKTLEEPPENVIILIGCTAEYKLIPTVLSRVKKLKIGEFKDEVLFDALSSVMPDGEKLKIAIENGDGTLGKAEELYGGSLNEISEFADRVIAEMDKSSSLMDFSEKALSFGKNYGEFLSVLKVKLGKMLKSSDSDLSQSGWRSGSVLAAVDRINEAEKKLFYNVSPTVITDALFLGIMEDKFKWRKVLS